MSRLGLLLFVSGLIFLGACPPPGMAETTDPESLPDPSVPIRLNATEREIHAKLCDPTQMDFDETPLEEVVEFLEEVHGIEILLDETALDEIGVGSDTPATIRVRGIPLNSGLALLFRRIDPLMTIEVRHDVLLITTREAAAEKAAILVYDVRALLQGKQSAQQLTEAVALVLELDNTLLARHKTNKAAEAIAKDGQKNEADLKHLPSLGFFNQYMILRAPEEQQRKVQQLLKTLHRGRLDPSQLSLIESLEHELIAERKVSKERITELQHQVWELERHRRRKNDGQEIETDGADDNPFGADGADDNPFGADGADDDPSG
jgi:hypothetical protein